MDNEINPSQEYLAFENWYKDNKKLVEDLQSWLFYAYALSEKKFGEVESTIEVADMTIFLELFYFSSLQGNKYKFQVTLPELVKTLETTPEVVLEALKSLKEHDILTYKKDDDNLSISIKPIGNFEHHHHHHH